MTNLPKDIVRKIDLRNLQIDDKFKNKLKQDLLAMEDNNMGKATNKGTREIFKLFKYNFASLVLVILALVAVGGVSAVVSKNRTKQASLRETSIPDSLTDVLSTEIIREKAAQDFPEGTITGIELEQEDEGLVYKVKFSDGSVRLYNAVTGGAFVLKDNDIETDDSVPADFESSISLQEARDIAQSQRPGKTIKKIELETEHGVVVYSVRFTDGGRVDVNAKSGSITRSEGANQSGSDSGGSDDSSDSSGSGSSNSGSDDDKADDNSGSGSGQSGGSDDD